jgi:hypothetical protein
MDGDRKMAFVALARLLDATPAGAPMITAANDAIAKYAEAAPVEPEHADFVSRNAFVDAVQAEKNL